MLSKLIVALLTTSALALPQPSSDGGLEKRVVGEAIDGGFFGEKDGIGAATQAAPVFMFTRDNINTGKANREPCYPEGAGNSKGDGPNPGTDPTPDQRNCRHPVQAGQYKGPFTKGEPFPVYFSVVWCGVQWKINYSLYYTHDVGHKHDWESVTVTFSEWPKGSNKWYRDSVYASQHSGKEENKWWEIQTVNMRGDDMDVRPIDGLNKLHAKIYVGMWHQAMYFAKGSGPWSEAQALTNGKKYEAKGDDYWYLPVESDMIKSGTLGEPSRFFDFHIQNLRLLTAGFVAFQTPTKENMVELQIRPRSAAISADGMISPRG
ncbi:MAG: hypothetical protein M1812_002703 [Candelaria pacifica]|nr:MAG: hypothetical protein M1812_002703 [Candelaria pacifica]